MKFSKNQLNVLTIQMKQLKVLDTETPPFFLADSTDKTCNLVWNINS